MAEKLVSAEREVLKSCVDLMISSCKRLANRTGQIPAAKVAYDAQVASLMLLKAKVDQLG